MGPFSKPLKKRRLIVETDGLSMLLQAASHSLLGKEGAAKTAARHVTTLPIHPSLDVALTMDNGVPILDLDALTYYPPEDCASDPSVVHVDRPAGLSHGNHSIPRKFAAVKSLALKPQDFYEKQDGRDPDFLPPGFQVNSKQFKGRRLSE